MEEKVVGAFQWLLRPCFHFLLCMEHFSAHLFQKKLEFGKRKPWDHLFIQSHGEVLIPLKFLKKLPLNLMEFIGIQCYQDVGIPGLFWPLLPLQSPLCLSVLYPCSSTLQS